MGNIEKAITKTLSYYLIFDFPLTSSEIWRFLHIQKNINFYNFFQRLEQLVKHEGVYKIKNYYSLVKNKKLILKREEQVKIGKKKILLAQKTANLLSLLPSIEFVGLSGKLALEIAAKEDDIDLFLITKPGMIWITRLFVLLFLSFVGLRRKQGDNDVTDKICLNMLVDTKHLTIPKKERDLFAAHEIAQLKTLFDRGYWQRVFLWENQWIKDCLGNITSKVDSSVKKLTNKKDIYLVNSILRLLEYPAKKIQLWYMLNKRTTEVIKDGYIRFHPADARKWILPEYDKLIEQFLLRFGYIDICG